MSDAMQRLKVGARAEASLFKIRTRKAVRSALLLAVGMVFGLFAIGVFNYAAFEALHERIGAFKAGVLVGGCNLVIAALLVRSALREEPDSEEEKLALEVRAMTYDSFGDDLSEARDEVRGFVSDVRRIRGAVALVTGGLSDPVNWALDIMKSFLGSDRVGDAMRSNTPPSAVGREPEL